MLVEIPMIRRVVRTFLFLPFLLKEFSYLFYVINQIPFCNIILCFQQELFIQELARCSLEKSPKDKAVGYSELADIVNSEETLQFLQGNMLIKFQSIYIKTFI